MGAFAYCRCMECDEEKLFSDGSRCARCLGLSYAPINNEDREDDGEESSRISLDILAAAHWSMTLVTASASTRLTLK